MEKNEYIKKASESLMAYLTLYWEYEDGYFGFKYRNESKKIFFDLYEDVYNYNELQPVEYAHESPKVLLKYLKSKGQNVSSWVLKKFLNVAFDDNVIQYIMDNDLINLPDFESVIYRIPKLSVLKLTKDRPFIINLPDHDFDDNMKYMIKKLNYKGSEIEDYLRKNKKTKDQVAILNCPWFILFLLEEDLDNIKFFSENGNINDELVNYLCSHNYVYKKGHCKRLMENEKLARLTIEKGNISLLLEEDIPINQNCLEFLFENIVANKLQCLDFNNTFLLKNDEFVNKIINYLNLDNPFNLEKKYLITRLGRTLSKLQTVFSLNDIEIIKREIIENNYCIDMVGILENIDVLSLKNIYNLLYKKECKFNDNFSFYYFIKVMDYFAGNLPLVKELSNAIIDDLLISNLALAINCGDYINYEQLLHYDYLYKEKIDKTNISIDDKLYKLLFNYEKNENAGMNLSDILNVYQLMYLQLNYSFDSVEYKILKNYIELAKLIQKIEMASLEEKKVMYNAIKDNFVPRALFDYRTMRENILRLYARMYMENGLNEQELKNKGKYQQINDYQVYDITGERFNLYIHNEDFHLNDGFLSFDSVEVTNEKRNNYLCCELVSDIKYGKIDFKGRNDSLLIYSIDNPNSLIAFGNCDINIEHTISPLISAKEKFVNNVYMSVIYDHTKANTEFDFLRYDDHNKKYKDSMIIFNNIDEAKKYINEKGSQKKILVFNPELHNQYLINEKNRLLSEVSTIEFKEIYRLIALLIKYNELDFDNNVQLSGLSERIINLDAQKKEIIMNLINDNSEKKQTIKKK